MKRRRWATALLVAVSLCAAPWLVATVIFIAANGVTFASLALVCADFALIAGLLAAHERRASRALVALVLLALAVDVAFVAQRLAREVEAGPLRYCEAGHCDGQPPLLARLVSEHETVRAGLLLSSITGGLFSGEDTVLGPALERAYARHDASPRFRTLPNAVFIAERGYLAYVPEGATNVPCIVFLHGFGGQLSVYVEALIEGGLGDVAIVAPFGDVTGRFDLGGNEALRTLVVSYLPPEVDRARVYMLGLSNGAVSASHLISDPAMRGLFAGAILLVGSDAPGAAAYRGFPVLFIAGDDDPRFPLGMIRNDASAFAARGALVRLEPLSGDHFVLLTHNRAVAGRVRPFVEGEARRAIPTAP